MYRAHVVAFLYAMETATLCILFGSNKGNMLPTVLEVAKQILRSPPLPLRFFIVLFSPIFICNFISMRAPRTLVSQRL